MKLKYFLLFVFSISGIQSLIASAADTSKKDVIIVRLVETVGASKFDSEIIVYYGKDSLEKITLKNVSGWKGYPIANLEKIQIVFKRLYSLGFELVSTYESGGATNFLFYRKE